jgi:hypothetical protein
MLPSTDLPAPDVTVLLLPLAGGKVEKYLTVTVQPLIAPMV